MEVPKLSEIPPIFSPFLPYFHHTILTHISTTTCWYAQISRFLPIRSQPSDGKLTHKAPAPLPQGFYCDINCSYSIILVIHSATVRKQANKVKLWVKDPLLFLFHRYLLCVVRAAIMYLHRPYYLPYHYIILLFHICACFLTFPFNANEIRSGHTASSGHIASQHTSGFGMYLGLHKFSI